MSCLEALASRPPDRPAFPSQAALSFREIVERRHVFCTFSLVATTTRLRPRDPVAALPSHLPAPPGGARGPLCPRATVGQERRRRCQPGWHTALGRCQGPER